MPATPSTAVLPLTGDNFIDGLTTGYRWNLDASRTISWSIADGIFDEVWFNPSVAARQINQAFQTFVPFIDAQFRYEGYFSDPVAAAPVSQITVSLDGYNAFTGSSAVWAVGHFPTTSSDRFYEGQSGDVFLNLRSAANFLPSYEPGSKGFALILHELGHALGLKHPHDGGGIGRPTFSALGLKALDQEWGSIMSYNDTYSWNLLAYSPVTPMALDVLGLMYLYGVNQSTNAGNSTHVLTRDNNYASLWDANGVDTLDLTRNREGWTIDLGLTVDRTLNIKVGVAAPTVEYAASAPKSLDWLLGDYENVVGSNFADTITGNTVNNVIYGIAGDDLINGGAGSDTAGYLGRRANFTISRSGTEVIVKDNTGSEGTDRLTAIETLRFSDVHVVLETTSLAQGYRLYQAAFNRTPDQSGLSFWAKAMNNGIGLREVSGEFVRSAEFRSIYGANPTAEQVVDRFYKNVLGRTGEPGGVSYWVNSVKTGATLESVLLGFSESPENIAKVAGLISNGITLDLF